MGKQRIEYTKVDVTQRGGVVGQIEEVPDHDVDKDAEIVGVEVFVSRRCGEQEVEYFEDEELKGGFVYDPRGNRNIR